MFQESTVHEGLCRDQNTVGPIVNCTDPRQIFFINNTTTVTITITMIIIIIKLIIITFFIIAIITTITQLISPSITESSVRS